MATEKTHLTATFPTQNDIAQEDFLNVRGEYALNFKKIPLINENANRWLELLRNSFNRSSPEQWFHLEAKKCI